MNKENAVGFELVGAALVAASDPNPVKTTGYFRRVATGEISPQWLNFGTIIGQITGNYDVINFMTGWQGLQEFFFRTPKWPIGGIYFDGILKTEHVSRIRPTDYPVQTGVIMTDHAIVEPAELTIEVMMSDAANSRNSLNIFSSFSTLAGVGIGRLFGSKISSIFKSVMTVYSRVYSNFAEWGGSCFPSSLGGKTTRSMDAWIALRQMQIERTPISVETRLHTYNNMIIEEISTPDDVQTLHAMKCTVRLREIVFAGVAETQVSARLSSTATEQQGGSEQSEEVSADNRTALKAAIDGGSVLTAITGG